MELLLAIAAALGVSRSRQPPSAPLVKTAIRAGSDAVDFYAWHEP